jgi:hypothetical protein
MSDRAANDRLETLNLSFSSKRGDSVAVQTHVLEYLLCTLQEVC